MLKVLPGNLEIAHPRFPKFKSKMQRKQGYWYCGCSAQCKLSTLSEKVKAFTCHCVLENCNEYSKSWAYERNKYEWNGFTCKGILQGPIIVFASCFANQILDALLF